MKQNARHLWRTLHVWLALIAGLWFSILGVSGSLLVYHESLDRKLNQALFDCGWPQADVSLERAHDVIQALHPDTPINSIYKGAGRTDAWRAYVRHPHVPGEALEVLYCPSTGEVLGSRGWATAALSRSTAFSWTYALHYSLLLRGAFWGDTGQYLVGGLGLLLSVSLLSGMVLWWPRGGKWRQALWLKPRASSVRRHFDLHRVVGYLSLIPLLLISLSGVQMALGAWVNPMVDKVAPLRNHALPDVSVTASNQPRLSLDQLHRIAQTRFPGAELNGVRVGLHSSPVVFNFLQPQELRAELGTSRVTLDPWTGAILQVRDPLAGSAGDDLLEWMFPLHTGEAFGTPGRIIVLVAGFAPVMLFSTGLLLWNRKRKSRVGAAVTTPRLTSVNQSV